MNGRNPEDIRAETRANQDASYFIGYGRDFESSESAPFNTPAQSSHKSRPTGRPLEGPSGGDISRIEANLDAIENPMTPEEKAEVRRSMGHASFLLEKERLAYEAMLRHADGDPKQLAVEMRKLADGKK